MVWELELLLPVTCVTSSTNPVHLKRFVPGLVNGAGSLGTVIEGPIIGLVAEYYGWMGNFDGKSTLIIHPFYSFSGVFLLMVTLSGIGALALLRAIIIRSSKEASSKEEF